jgi:hypothetical protein
MAEQRLIICNTSPMIKTLSAVRGPLHTTQIVPGDA